MELVFGYIAGLLTLINPCVLPVLPIVLASALQAGRHGPLAIAVGMGVSFVSLGMLVATVGHSIGLTEDLLSRIGAILMKGQFVGGLLLGAIWSPCIGPTLGGAISLASQGQDLFWAFLIMLSFALGIGSVVVALGYGTGEAIRRRQDKMRSLAHKAKPIMGLTFLIVGIMIFFKFHYVIEGWLVDVLPDWFLDLSTNF